VINLPSLRPGDQVYVRDQGKYGKITEKLNQPRSYNVHMANGNVIRRNRRSLIHTGVEEDTPKPTPTRDPSPVSAPSTMQNPEA
jgi:hypothetical protein